LDKQKTEAACKATAENFVPAFAFQIANRNVTILEKTRNKNDPFLVGYLDRAKRYQALFQEAVEFWCPDLNIVVCANMDDGHYAHPAFPVFGFQKPYGKPEVLLPDVDFLIHQFYTPPQFQDHLEYHQKRNRASFVGAITGAVITTDIVRTLALPRLQAAAHFHRDPDVDFRLPLLAECDSEAARQALAALPFCGGETADWAEQRVNRFLISMDGNGATCSRVVAALKSNSILLKYASPHVLYYFGGLNEWQHFIPIHAHHDVKSALALERTLPGTLEHIAREGKNFAETFLSRQNVVFYTAAILSLYDRCFTDANAGATATDSSRPATTALQSEAADWTIIAHIQHRGDTPGKVNEWIGAPGSGQWLEGFTIYLGQGEADFQLEYCTLLPDGTPSPWKHSGEFCGTRSRSVPLLGLCIRMQGEAESRLELKYEARFLDGFTTELMAAEQICASPLRAPLEAFRITLRPTPP
jgi:hypothetical protein